MENNFYLKETEEKNKNHISTLNFKRKHLPSVTPMDEISHFRPFFLEYSLTNEYNLLIKQKINSVLIMPSAKDCSVWNGVLFVQQGLYQGGVFRFKIKIPNGFPDSNCPEINFSPPIYHPIIHQLTGALDVSRAFHSWKKNYHHIWQVVQYAKRIFVKIETDKPLNHEAATLYNEDLELFKSKVKHSIELSNSLLYEDPDPDDEHAIRFDKLDDEQYQKIKNEIFNKKKENCVEESLTDDQSKSNNENVDENICLNNSIP